MVLCSASLCSNSYWLEDVVFLLCGMYRVSLVVVRCVCMCLCYRARVEICREKRNGMSIINLECLSIQELVIILHTCLIIARVEDWVHITALKMIMALNPRHHL